MLQTKKFSIGGRNRGFLSGRPSLPRKLFQVAAAGRWSLESFFDALRNKPRQQLNQHSSSSYLTDRLLVKEHVWHPLPPTFQHLSSELIVLLDPKNERLVYLLGVDDSSSADDVVDQTRGLLQATAAPYVHLMALPADLGSSMLRQFPGGQPVITFVPLPADLATALQQRKVQQEGVSMAAAGGPVLHHEGSHLVPLDEKLGLSAVTEECDPLRSRQWAPGGVLELLYGVSELQPGGLGEEDAVASASAGNGSGEEEVDGGRNVCEWDVPDEVLSRRKAAGRLMAWHKGASMRVARRRSERMKYKFDWLIQGLNSIDQLSVAVMTPNIILLRNNVEANLGVDDLYNIDEDSDDDDDEGEGGGKVKVIKLQVDGSEGLAQGLAEVLKAIGAQEDGRDTEQSEKDDDDDDDDNNVIEVEDLAELLSMLANDSDSDEEGEGDNDGNHVEASSSDGDEDTPSDNLLARSLRSGPFREVMPGVFVQVVDGGIRRITEGDDNSSDDDDDAGNGVGGGRKGGVEEDDDDVQHDWDMTTTLDVQLSPGPMGWTALVRVGNDRDGRTNGGDTAAGGRRDALREALHGFVVAADAEYLQNIRRLEALWDKEAREDTPQQEPHQGQQQEEAVSKHESSARPLEAAGPHGASGDQDDGSGAEGPSSRPGLEADWRQAERRGASRGGSPGRGFLSFPPGGGVGAAAVLGAVPTDRLMRPPRRPGSVAPDVSAGAAGGAANEGQSRGEAPAGGRVVRDEGEAQSYASTVGDSAADGLISSTRARGRSSAEGVQRGNGDAGPAATHQAPSDGGMDEGTDVGADGLVARTRPMGRSRMVRRPRGRVRIGRQSPDSSPGPSAAGVDVEAGTAASLSASTSQSAPGKEAEKPHSPAAATGASDNSSTSSGADEALAIPAYRHMKQVPGSGSTITGSLTAGADVGAGAAGGVGNISRPAWGGRTGPGAPTPQVTGGSGGGSGLPPEAAGYAALDLEQLAHFVLGRQASPEEVQDLARAVAQSAEVEEAFGSITGGQPHAFHQQPGPQQKHHGSPGLGGDRSGKQPRRRHGTLLPSRAAPITASRNRRSIVTPRCRRLRIPEPVLQLAGFMRGRQRERGVVQPDAAEQTGLDFTDVPPVAEGRRMLSKLMLRRLGQRPAGEGALPSSAASAPQHVQAQLQQQSVNQTELAAVMLGAFRDAPLRERQAAEALVDFLRRRRQPGQTRDSQRGPGYGDQQRPGVAEVHRSSAGLPGLVRGQDAVVVMPKSLLEATVGAWQEQEQRLMHEGYRNGQQDR